MAQKTKIKAKEITISEDSGAFNAFFRRLAGEHKEYDFDNLEMLRRLLSNEKARLLHTIKAKKPKSIYELAKFLQRDFKAVNEDVKLLNRFGFIHFVKEKTGKRERLKPLITRDTIRIDFKI
jgi:predicted transcriptional regulator